ncbi:KUP/HAK/KT family potassium transporter [Rubellicoccus peritrichatus]|uniref:Probable potassium transport system protein Kup n=1 Tax=Rubellicoccus peritrichatus TaxID=3080537 RepID=A0AAQ3LE41_9BACT|nr:KUP/HAK/KT family potassium transporter [Puniceicoccus sp. CR14]WOO41893.1 KUP/HAK/KT family potassium transporter [Puniceicoccus sp. CR14]
MEETAKSEGSPPASNGNPQASKLARRGLTLAALGVVFGDIGTSPLYSFNAACAFADKARLNQDVLGIVSLFFWTLIFVVSVKYLIFIMRADNEGEGGIFALHALLQKYFSDTKRIPFLFMLIAFGGALLVGDGVITPAISVLSAMEGLEVIDPGFDQYVVPLTLVILFVLFVLQRLGTGGLGMIFGPIMLAWFIAIGGMGLYQLISNGSEILRAVNPYYGFEFLYRERIDALGVLGAVVLCVTGAEALYADMGHFGRSAIRRAWLVIAMPALILNYLGQGAFLLSDELIPKNLFFEMIPKGWWTLALVMLATVATVIASQAIISGVFSLVRQAIQMRFWPNVPIVHTSDKVEAQIFIPMVNLFLGIACILTVLIFRSSENLASAYGIAVTGTMAITSVAYFYVRWKHWHKNLLLSILLVAAFLIVDLSFFIANITKIGSGGAYPLLIAALVFLVMVTWKIGRRHITQSVISRRRELPEIFEKIDKGSIHKAPGLAVYLTPHYRTVPSSLENLSRFYGVMREYNIIVIPHLDYRPVVPGDGLEQVEKLGENFYRVTFRFGYRERPDLSRVGPLIQERMQIELPLDDTVFHFSRERAFLANNTDMPHLLKILFVVLSKNSQPPQEMFIYPPKHALEVVTPVFL